MKFFLVTFLVAILVALTMAADADQQPIIVSFPEGTPYSEMDELKAEIAKVVSPPGRVVAVSQSTCGSPGCAVLFGSGWMTDVYFVLGWRDYSRIQPLHGPRLQGTRGLHQHD